MKLYVGTFFMKKSDGYPQSLYLILSPAGWKLDEMVGALAAIKDCKGEHGNRNHT